ncbi:hypothetical protein [Levilactobacillus suantsaii]|uniref:Uncharacterized protein n=1 Tax=Levilactobacillus suantsaii TaxID=2292255 RepID=A0A4Q0VI83_9LACO|nr:hypothetical protein [Levilactobacillus suantsaii]QMU08551.1 hypothetical protein H3M12_02415 [Levilactobacillus suantsaii]RXI78455.1 hypothetical protein DXH47_06735 [Levilactobacillus suantsaii]
MTHDIVLPPATAQLLVQHLSAWAQWQRTRDPLTAAASWDQFIAKSRDKAQWEGGMTTEIDQWEALHDLLVTLETDLAAD